MKCSKTLHLFISFYFCFLGYFLTTYSNTLIKFWLWYINFKNTLFFSDCSIFFIVSCYWFIGKPSSLSLQRYSFFPLTRFISYVLLFVSLLWKCLIILSSLFIVSIKELGENHMLVQSWTNGHLCSQLVYHLPFFLGHPTVICRSIVV